MAVRACKHCGRAIFKSLSMSDWYHKHNSSVSCKPGWQSTTATPKGE